METFNVTRQQMIEAVDARTSDAHGNQLPWAEHRCQDGSLGAKTLAEIGYNRRLEIAIALYNRLVDGGVPTTREVVGYFGKGARFIE